MSHQVQFFFSLKYKNSGYLSYSHRELMCQFNNLCILGNFAFFLRFADFI